MTLEQKRIKIAEACGWKPYFNGKDNEDWESPDKIIHPDIPDYFSDLNACHEMEKVLEIGNDGSEWAEYQESLWNLVNPRIIFNSDNLHDVGYCKNFISATAQQRAETFGITKGLWKEGE